MLIRAATVDREMLGALGVNVAALYTQVFVFGSWLAGLGGALAAPTVAVALGMDGDVLTTAFVVVVISRRALESTFAADNGEGSDEAGLFAVDRSRSHRFDPENEAVFKSENWIVCERASALRIVTDRREGDGTDRAVEGEP